MFLNSLLIAIFKHLKIIKNLNAENYFELLLFDVFLIACNSYHHMCVATCLVESKTYMEVIFQTCIKYIVESLNLFSGLPHVQA